MKPLESPPSNSVYYFVVGVLGVAVLLGIYFAQLNAEVDRAREAASARLELCRQMQSVARSVLPKGLETPDSCEHLNAPVLESVTPR